MAQLKRYWKVVLPLSIVLLALGLYFGNDRYQAYKEKEAKEYYGKFLSYVPPQKIRRATFLDNQSVAIDWENTDKEADRYISTKHTDRGLDESTSNYLVKENYRLRGYATIFGLLRKDGVISNHNALQKGEYWSVKIYKKSGKKISRPTEINIPKIVKRYLPDYFPSHVHLVEKGKTTYLQINVAPLPSKNKNDNSEIDSLYIDISTQKAVEYSEIKGGSSFSLSDLFYYKSNLRDKLNERGIEFIGNGLYLTKKGMKNSKQWQIAKQYPKAYKILKNGGSLYLMKDEMDMDYTAKILQLFAPKGTDIFDGTKIPARLTTDGQEHTVTSYEEFKKYYKIEDTE